MSKSINEKFKFEIGDRVFHKTNSLEIFMIIQRGLCENCEPGWFPIYWLKNATRHFVADEFELSLKRYDESRGKVYG